MPNLKKIINDELSQCAFTKENYSICFLIANSHREKYIEIVNYIRNKLSCIHYCIAGDMFNTSVNIQMSNYNHIIVQLEDAEDINYGCNKYLVDDLVSEKVFNQIPKDKISFINVMNKKYYMIAKDGIFYQPYIKYFKKFKELTEQIYKEIGIKREGNHLEGIFEYTNTETSFIDKADNLSPLNYEWIKFINDNELKHFDIALSNCFGLNGDNEDYVYNVYYVDGKIYYSIEADVNIYFDEYYKNDLIEITKEEFLKGVKYEHSTERGN